MSETKANNKEKNICLIYPIRTDIELWAPQVTSPCIIMQYLVGVAYGLIYFLGRLSYSTLFYRKYHLCLFNS